MARLSGACRHVQGLSFAGPASHPVQYRMTGMVLWHRRHFTCVVNSGDGYVYVDDAQRRVLKSWKDVRHMCMAGALHPYLLLYERV